jgi:hypothetical protein
MYPPSDFDHIAALEEELRILRNCELLDRAGVCDQRSPQQYQTESMRPRQAIAVVPIVPSKPAIVDKAPMSAPVAQPLPLPVHPFARACRSIASACDMFSPTPAMPSCDISAPAPASIDSPALAIFSLPTADSVEVCEAMTTPEPPSPQRDASVPPLDVEDPQTLPDRSIDISDHVLSPVPSVLQVSDHSDPDTSLDTPDRPSEVSINAFDPFERPDSPSSSLAHAPSLSTYIASLCYAFKIIAANFMMVLLVLLRHRPLSGIG